MWVQYKINLVRRGVEVTYKSIFESLCGFTLNLFRKSSFFFSIFFHVKKILFFRWK